MTKDEAMKLALDALENHTAIKHPQQMHYRDTAIEALRQALEQSERTCIKDLTKQCVKENGHCYMGVNHD